METELLPVRSENKGTYERRTQIATTSTTPAATQLDAVPTKPATRPPSFNRALARDYSDVWATFWATKSSAARAELIEVYLYLVDEVVRRIPSGVSAHWSSDDLQSFGALGLINAVDRRRPELAQIPFAIYARRRIQGAIYDELRKLDWLPRTARRRVIEFNKTEDELRVDLCRSPNRAEILAAMDITDLRRTASIVAALQRSQTTSLDSPIRGEDQGTLLDSIREAADTEVNVLQRIDHDALRSALSSLPERQRSVITHRFVEQLSFRETGKLVGISESRARQVELDALRGLRHLLDTPSAA